MQEEALTDEYNMELYTYHSYKCYFKGKLCQIVLSEMRAKPNHEFTVNELIKLVLIRDG
ncbi:hypothetical protein BV195_00240 [Haemophilus influenzae]|uniref:Uncharacterized protein n=1 Tax=Haemophilus influenzae TaxID=727 RepID=A0A2S9RRZ3_HAEIF|nr:hypothetical protein BVZ56_00066 [Haemophilus influenzae]PRI45913.1 hypothetical protein BVZ70_01882 [Haemophilus influenzae]PRI87604.1 hypothetical protein BV021_00234 [Haemophilus influenzae]PRI87868.1 hypothetical protein BV020_01761 [Haemophilus influenzae]PRJ11545.1 hypothetical protein BV025_00049 [Haemophilus influenzae]